MKIRRFKSLTFKLTVWYIVILGIIVFLAGFFMFQGFKDRLMNDMDRVLLQIADETYEAWWRKRDFPWHDAIAKVEERFASYQPYIQLVQISENGEQHIEAITRSPRIPADAYQLDTQLYFEADKSDIDDLIYLEIEDDLLNPHPLRVILFPIRGPNVLQVGISLESNEGALNQLTVVMIVAGLILMLLASLGGSFIINKALHPVKTVVNTARDISADDLSLRIEDKRRQDEIGALIEAFNDMISRLEISIDKIRQFSGDASHELRTPLTIIRGEIEVLLRKDRPKKDYIQTLDSVLEESHRMEKIIDNLLYLSRIETLNLSKLSQYVSLHEVVNRAINSRRQSADLSTLKIDSTGVKAAMIKGDENLLDRMITNVIDNAIRYNRKGGRIDIFMEDSGNQVQLEIRDSGIGIPEAELPNIFDRFYVVDKSRSRETGGIGLGLSIVKRIADIHSASIEVTSDSKTGTSFFIKFPVH